MRRHMAGGGGVSEMGAPPEHSRRSPVTRPLLLWGPPHDPGGAGQQQAVRCTGGPGAGRRAGAPGSTWAGGRGGAATGTPQPHGAASSRRWPGRDCMVSARRRRRRRVPPAARLLPCRGLRAPADSRGRWRRSRDAPGSAPPLCVLSHPFAHLRRALNGARRRQSHGRRRTALSRPARVTCL